MRKMTVLIAAAAIFLGLGVMDVHGQTPKKESAGKPGSGKSQIVIEFVSFPDQYKRYEVYPGRRSRWTISGRPTRQWSREGKFEDWVRSLTAPPRVRTG